MAIVRRNMEFGSIWLELHIGDVVIDDDGSTKCIDCIIPQVMRITLPGEATEIDSSAGDELQHLLKQAIKYANRVIEECQEP